VSQSRAIFFCQAVGYLLNALLPSWKLFWPDQAAWPDSSLVLIWDAESTRDREAAANISLLYPTVRHVYEAQSEEHKRVFEDCGSAPASAGMARIPGYQRQTFSNFIQDEVNVLEPFDGESGPPEFLG
jgi:hypothetical protein